jgi:2-oxoisovalerate ferredoxin oxidoreductase beta subunit
MEGKGFSIVEMLSQCPTGWKMDPVDSIKWVDENMAPVFPPKVFKDEPRERPEPPHPADYDRGKVDEIVRGMANGDEVELRHETLPWAEVLGPKVDQLKIKAAGFGGQGILALGELIAKGAIREGMEATWLPSYGPEMRGGTANCSVVLSGREIGNPTVVQSNVLIAMNRPSMEKFESELDPGGILIYDSSLIDVAPSRKDIKVFPVQATEIADKLGSPRVANVVMVGALMGVLGFPGENAVTGIVKKFGRTEKIRKANLEALLGGMKATRATATS